MRFGSQVPRPYQAKRVKRVISAKATEIPKYGALNSDEKPVPDELGSCALSPRVAAGLEPALGRVSGRYLKPNGTTTKSATAATKNMAGQPKAGIIGIPTNAAMEPPIGTPDIINVAMEERHLAGTSSATMALADGTRPP